MIATARRATRDTWVGPVLRLTVFVVLGKITSGLGRDATLPFVLALVPLIAYMGGLFLVSVYAGDAICYLVDRLRSRRSVS